MYVEIESGYFFLFNAIGIGLCLIIILIIAYICLFLFREILGLVVGPAGLEISNVVRFIRGVLKDDQ